MVMFLLQTIAAYLLDLIIGDPPRLPHPVIFIGGCIGKLDGLVRHLAATPTQLKLAGFLIAIVITASSYVLTALVLYLVLQLNYILYLFVGTWLIATTMATRGLALAASEVRGALASGDIKQARRKVGWIVGRDTGTMETENVVRATVETVAENTVDAVIAPIFYACIGGPALAMAYRAINTLDSMLGYKNEKYLYLGWASARLDDIANYIPARIAGILFIVAAWISNRNCKNAIKSWRRDASHHPSPNSGIPESSMAGALGIRLGGKNIYHGVESFRHLMGDQRERLRPDHIAGAVDMLYQASAIFILIVALLTALLII